MIKRLVVALLVLLTACSEVTVETTTLSGSIRADTLESPGTSEVEDLAEQICTANAWVGIAEPATFSSEAASLSVDPSLVSRAVHTACPDTFYKPLSKAEVDWCGDGQGLGQNFFLVVDAGIALGVESFSIVEPGLIAKAQSRNYVLSDYEVELLTAELQTMSESSRFERDWAEACRSTF